MQGMHVKNVLPIFARLGLGILMLVFVCLLVFSPKQARADSTVVTHQVVGPQVPQGQSGTLTVSCASGEQLLSGGFYGNGWEGAVYVVENYPSAANAWTVTVNNTIAPSWVQMTAYVYCLQASYSIGTTVVHTTNTGSGMATANCPAGSVLLGGGYAGPTKPVSSSPNANSWQSDSANVYATCATQNLTAAPVATATFLTPSTWTFLGVTASCGIGQLATGGGFTRSVNNNSNPIVSSAASTAGQGWNVSAGNSSSGQVQITVWAVCVIPPEGISTTPTVVRTVPPPVTPTPTTTSPACKVSYTVTSQWTGGFGASVMITNTGTTTINGWTLKWTFANGQTITQLWNGSYTQSGAAVAVTNLSYNGTLAPGSNTSFGFNGSWNNTVNARPTAFTLNGQPCSVS